MLAIEELFAFFGFGEAEHVTFKLFSEEILFFLGVTTVPFGFLSRVPEHVSLLPLIVFPISLASTLLCPSFVKVTVSALLIVGLRPSVLPPKVFGLLLIETRVMSVEVILCLEVAVEVT